MEEIGSRVINKGTPPDPMTMVDPNGTWSSSGVLWDHKSMANHPVGFDYEAAQAAKPTKLRTWQEVNAAMGTSVFFRSNATASKPSGRQYTSMECSSCHTAHDDTYSPFLRRSMAGHQLCLTCHLIPGP
ncbi:MAG: cytochrome c3 family protein [Geobacteraceae bacterium]|nr:cytochrome c3 family protein [Geobacteraceae bacterium]